MNESSYWYFLRLCENIQAPNHRRLLSYLYDIQFYAVLEMDKNRIGDAIYYRESYYSYFSDTEDVSVLEVMMSLANRCSIEYGNPINFWFWGMIDSLGLYEMNDDNYNESYVKETIFKFLNREYEPDGTGGLFRVPGIDTDMRDMEIWDQMIIYSANLF